MNLFALSTALPVLARGDGPENIVPVVAIVFCFLWLIVKALVSPFVAKKDRCKKGDASEAASSASTTTPPSASEFDAIRQLSQTLARMEARVEALETILIERSRSSK